MSLCPAMMMLGFSSPVRAVGGARRWRMLGWWRSIGVSIVFLSRMEMKSGPSQNLTLSAGERCRRAHVTKI